VIAYTTNPAGQQYPSAVTVLELARAVAQVWRKKHRYRTASGSDRMLTLNWGLRGRRIAGSNVASARYRSRFWNDLLLLQPKSST